MGEAGDQPLVLGGAEATHHTAQTSSRSRVLFSTKPCDQVHLYPPATLRSSPVLVGLQTSHELASQTVNCCMNAGWELGVLQEQVPCSVTVYSLPAVNSGTLAWGPNPNTICRSHLSLASWVPPPPHPKTVQWHEPLCSGQSPILIADLETLR